MTSYKPSLTVPVNVLPEKIQQILKDGGYHRRDISVYRCDATCPSPSSGHGERSTVTTYNEESGKTQAFQGSFGGSNMFTRTIDDVRKEVSLNDGDWLITVTSAYPQNYASLKCNDATAAKLNIPKSEAALEGKEGAALNLIAHTTSSYRKESWRREIGGNYGADHPIIVSLEQKGLIKINKAGSISVTTLGKIAESEWLNEKYK